MFLSPNFCMAVSNTKIQKRELISFHHMGETKLLSFFIAIFVLFMYFVWNGVVRINEFGANLKAYACNIHSFKLKTLVTFLV